MKRVLVVLGLMMLGFSLIAVCFRGCDNKEAERRAIYNALDYDRAVSKKVADSRSLRELLFGANDETIANYVHNLKRVPLNECPADFQSAYHNHIDAWESRNNDRITATWLDVLSVARLHDVDYSVSPP